MTGSTADPRPLKIVFVIGSLQIGGSETQLVLLARDLKTRGNDVHVVAMSRGGPLESELRSLGVGVRVFTRDGLRRHSQVSKAAFRGLLHEAGQLVALWWHLRRLRADVCHALGFTCYTVALPIARAAGVPVRVNGRRGESPAFPTGTHRRIRDLLSARCSTRYICNSGALAQALEQHERVDARRIEVICNSVELPPSVADTTRQPPTGVVVANLLRYKGHADLIEALARLEAPPRICLIGDGPEREEIRRQIGAHGLTHVVGLAGTVPSARDALPGYQFAVLPSHTEGLPNAVLEAMAAGLPVIATAVGGVPEIVTDGRTGLLVRPHAPDELAMAIARLSADPRLRSRLGAAGRSVAERLGSGSSAARHEAVYRSALRTGRR